MKFLKYEIRSSHFIFTLNCNSSTDKYFPTQCQRNPYAFRSNRAEVLIEKETKIFCTHLTLKLLVYYIECMHLSNLTTVDVWKKQCRHKLD